MEWRLLWALPHARASREFSNATLVCHLPDSDSFYFASSRILLSFLEYYLVWLDDDLLDDRLVIDYDFPFDFELCWALFGSEFL